MKNTKVRLDKQNSDQNHSKIPECEALEAWMNPGFRRVGAWVESSDILVGRVTPKSDQPPEEKLLRAIFVKSPGCA